MKKFKNIIFLISLIFSLTANAETLIYPDDTGSTFKDVRSILVDATDGYTAETGLTPTCKIVLPGGTSGAACANSVSEVDSTNAPGAYKVTLSDAEVQTPGHGLLVMTGTGARPDRIRFTVMPSTQFSRYNLISVPNSLNSSLWTKTGATITADSTADYLARTIGDTLTGDGAATAHKAEIAQVKRSGGSGLYYTSVDVKSGTINNAWIGDSAWGVGIDVNTSTAVVTPTTNISLRGWKLEKIGSSWLRAHILYEIPISDGTYTIATIALGNGTAGSAPPSFASSGTMIFSNVVHSKSDDVDQRILETVAPNLQSAASTSTITLAASESATSNNYNGREICVWHQGAASTPSTAYKGCSCIYSYDGSTKVATLFNGLWTTPSSSHKYRIGGACPLNSVLQASSLTSSTFAAGAITSSAIAANAIGASQIASDAITSAKIANDSIGATEIAADAITGAKIATSAIGTDEFAQAAADEVWASSARTLTSFGALTLDVGNFTTAARNALADTTLRRTSANIEGSAYGDTLGFNSLYGVTQMQTGQSAVVAGSLNVYKSDNSTLLNSRSVTSSSSAAPMTGVGN